MLLLRTNSTLCFFAGQSFLWWARNFPRRIEYQNFVRGLLKLFLRNRLIRVGSIKNKRNSFCCLDVLLTRPIRRHLSKVSCFSKYKFSMTVLSLNPTTTWSRINLSCNCPEIAVFCEFLERSDRTLFSDSSCFRG